MEPRILFLLFVTILNAAAEHDPNEPTDKRRRIPVETSVGKQPVEHITIDTSAIQPPPPGFEPYQEYQGTFVEDEEMDSSNPPYFNVKLLNEKGVNNKDAFLANLPPIFKKRVVLLKRSGSNHDADAKNPRLIMFNYEPSGRSVDNHPLDMIAVGTHPQDKNRDLVERIHWNPKSRKFEFSSIDFSSGRAVTAPTEDCATCHTPFLRPNFDPAHNWPSTIGVRERFGIFDKRELSMLDEMYESNAIVKKHFNKQDLIRKDEQTPSTVLFYSLFGPVQQYASDHFVNSPRYQDNKLHLLKVLAGCKDDIRELKEAYPAFFKSKRDQIVKSRDKFQFTKNDNKEPILNDKQDPILNEEYADQLTSIIALFKTKEDDLGWFGKTSKITEMYTHAFFRQDFEMLMGGICERDPEVKELLIKHGADPLNPCYKRLTSVRNICFDKKTDPVIDSVVGEPIRRTSALRVGNNDQGGLVNCVFEKKARGPKAKGFCVNTPTGLKVILWNPENGFYYCQKGNYEDCPGKEIALDRRLIDEILQRHLAMEREFQKTGKGFDTLERRRQALEMYLKTTGKSLDLEAKRATGPSPTDNGSSRLVTSRTAVAKILQTKCFRCHQKLAEGPAPELFELPEKRELITPEFVAKLKKVVLKGSGAFAMERILTRIEKGEEDSPMPPGADEDLLTSLRGPVREWVKLERQSRND